MTVHGQSDTAILSPVTAYRYSARTTHGAGGFMYIGRTHVVYNSDQQAS